MEILIHYRNNALAYIYQNITKKILFKIDPEKVHDKVLLLGRILGSNYLTKSITKSLFFYSNSKLFQEIKGIKFNSPVGLVAGFDKDAYLTNILPNISFGFLEVGSITGEPCLGNSKPRLFRLKKSNALIINYGLKNQGCVKIANRLKNKAFKIPVGISIAKTNCKETADTEVGIKDYVRAYKEFLNIGDYYTINISCPNAFGGQPFTDKLRLNKLLEEINKVKKTKPIFIKLSPDLNKKEINNVIKLSKKYKIDGFICTNLTKNRNNKKILDRNIPKKGGISGKVVEDLSNNLIKYVYKKTKGKFIIIGCGGIFTAEDAYKKIKLGASLVQLVTGMIFQGPQVISQINQGLVKLLEKDNYKNINEAIGKGI